MQKPYRHIHTDRHTHIHTHTQTHRYTETHIYRQTHTQKLVSILQKFRETRHVTSVNIRQYDGLCIQQADIELNSW